MLSILQTIEYKKLTDIFKDEDVEIFDYIPGDDHDFYIVIGDADAERFYTKTFDGFEVTSKIFIYAIGRSQLQLKKVIQKIHYEFKNIEVSINNYYFEYFETMSFSSMRYDIDKVQGLIEIKYRVEEEK